MPVPTDILDLSTVASSNYPAGTENLNTADDYLRQQFAFIAQLRDAVSVRDYGAVGDGVTPMTARTDGGANTTLYVKESGTGNTGWIAK